MSRSFSLLSPAKLNLFLHITGQRPDGYHELQTLFQLLDWGDTLTFTLDTSGAVTLAGDDIGVPDSDNLILRAARLLHREGLGATIALHKRIPTGAGLGGGSSNAATTLLALNHGWRLGLCNKRLQEMGAGLGADVPVFVGARTAWAEGIGEILSPLTLPRRWYLILVPDCHVSTGQIFSHRQLTRNSKPIKMAAFFDGDSRNDCQNLVSQIYPEVANALKLLDKFGEARLTGTGACAFVSFSSEPEARAAQASLPQNCRSIVAGGVNESPALGELD